MQVDMKIQVDQDGSGVIGARMAVNREQFESIAQLMGDAMDDDVTCDVILAEADMSPTDMVGDAGQADVDYFEEDGWCVMTAERSFDTEAELQQMFAADAKAVELGEAFANEMVALAAFDTSPQPWVVYVDESANDGSFDYDTSIYALTDDGAQEVVSWGMSVADFYSDAGLDDPVLQSATSFLRTSTEHAVCVDFKRDVFEVGAREEVEVTAANATGDAAEIECWEAAEAAGFEPWESDMEPELVLRSLPEGGWEFRAPLDTGDDAELSDPDDMAAFLALYGPMVESMRFSFDVTLPGTPVDHNADEVDGSRFVWEFDFDRLMSGDTPEPYAITSANGSPPSTSEPADSGSDIDVFGPGDSDGAGAVGGGDGSRPSAATDDDSGMSPLLLAAGAVAAVTLAAGGVWLLRRRSTATPAVAQVGPFAPHSDQQTPPTPPASPAAAPQPQTPPPPPQSPPQQWGPPPAP